MNKDNTKTSANRQKKEVVIAEVLEKVTKAKAMVFTNYQGLTHKQLEALKVQLRTLDAEYAVTKNTLLKRALGQQIAQQQDQFQQPTGTLFLYGDPVAPIKALAKLVKDTQLPKIKFGLLEGKAITQADVMRLATLPSKNVLIAQLLGQMKAPIAGLHRALNWNLQQFVMTLKAVEQKKTTS